MAGVDPALRCTAASLADDEPLAGTAPGDTSWLFVEHPGPWGRKALAEARLPEEVRAHLAGLAGVRVQLVRRPGGAGGRDRPGLHVFSARVGDEGMRVGAGVLDDPRDLLDLDPDALPAYDAPLWLVCTNGRRDLCCAEQGRPVAAALAERWPEATWETTHLGGHRFAATLLALPSGVALGRLDAGSAVQACHELAAGRVPVDLARGRVGTPAAVQAAEVHVRRELGVGAVGAVRATAAEPAPDAGTGADTGTVTVTLRTPDGDARVRVRRSPGPARRQSCADLDSKSVDVYAVEAWVRLPA